MFRRNHAYGRDFAHRKLEDNAALVLNAYYKAPLATSRLDQKAMILSGEEMMPLLELIEKLAEKVGGHEATQNMFFPLYMDYLAIRVAIDEGRAPVILLLGANLPKQTWVGIVAPADLPPAESLQRISRRTAAWAGWCLGPRAHGRPWT